MYFKHARKRKRLALQSIKNPSTRTLSEDNVHPLEAFYPFSSIKFQWSAQSGLWIHLMHERPHDFSICNLQLRFSPAGAFYGESVGSCRFTLYIAPKKWARWKARNRWASPEHLESEKLSYDAALDVNQVFEVFILKG